MLPRFIPLAMTRNAVLCLFCLATATAVQAADLDRQYSNRPVRQRWSWQEDNGAFVTGHHGCRLIPQPQLNLWGEVSSYNPIWVCESRGLLADTMPPPPPPPPLRLTVGGIGLREVHEGIKATVRDTVHVLRNDAKEIREDYMMRREYKRSEYSLW